VGISQAEASELSCFSKLGFAGGLPMLARGSRRLSILWQQVEQAGDVGLVTLRPADVETERDSLLGHLYAVHRLSLVRLAVLLVGDQASAEDVVQDAFTAVWRRRHSLDDGMNAMPYLRKSVVNQARSVLRRRRVAQAFRPDRARQVSSAEDTVLLSLEHRELLNALRLLAPRQREVVVLRYWAGLSEAEIAETMGISKGAVKSMSHRSLAALRRRMET
jgi:RNA polymerase sigma-70 factor (sigma-E family)